ncbi:MAG: zincin-like metallopeptidase domain-containing protein [Waterburya sp.]
MVEQTQLFELQSEAKTQKFTFYSSLEKLNQACSSCNRCTLSQKRHQVVIGRGNTRPDIAIVGEAPGKQEDKLGQPFVGDSGKFLGKMLEVVKLDSNVYFTNEAFYDRKADFIGMPHRHQFSTKDAFYATRFHEEGHRTGHRDRLNRQLGNNKHNPLYHYEELVAELTAAYLGNEFGLASIELEHHASYLDHYLRLLKRDSRSFFSAAYEAQKATKYLMQFNDIIQEKINLTDKNHGLLFISNEDSSKSCLSNYYQNQIGIGILSQCDRLSS